MKKTINGKRYDTDKAELVAEYDSGHSTSDFHWHCERLYRTKRGRWFLLGEGGALSRYSGTHGSDITHGSTIVGFDADDALKWLSETGHEDVIDKYFADMVENA